MIATAVAVELLRFQPQSHRSSVLFTALGHAAKASGIDLQLTTHYRGALPWLMLWGPGARDRFEPMEKHRAAGGRVISWDCSYWNRQQKMRVSIDQAHPQAWILKRDWPAIRFKQDPVPIESAWKPTGPVVVAGIGQKAILQYGGDVAAWEQRMISEAQRRGRVVHYRPKKQGPVPAGLPALGGDSIERVLRGASLVITWHSNVAIDAIRLGIPAICRDGAAAAVCPSEWPAGGMPQPLSTAIRDRFLWNLAWFQWGTTQPEARGAWAFLQAMLS